MCAPICCFSSIWLRPSGALTSAAVRANQASRAWLSLSSRPQSCLLARALRLGGSAFGAEGFLDLAVECGQLFDDGAGAARLGFVAQLQGTHGLDRGMRVRCLVTIWPTQHHKRHRRQAQGQVRTHAQPPDAAAGNGVGSRFMQPTALLVFRSMRHKPVTQ